MAAALGPLLAAAPPPVKHAHTNNVHSRQSLVDPKLLTRRLEALQREKDAAQIRRDRRQSTPASGFVPRHAAQHFASTTTPMIDADAKAAKSKKAKRQSGDPATEMSSTMPHSSADGKPVLNPKQLHAALQIGMSEAEILTEPLSLVRLNSRENLEDQEPLVAPKERRSSAPNATPQRSTSTKAYKPGDAAKRNSMKRSSMMLIDNTKLVAVKHGSQTVYERVEIQKPRELPSPFDDIDEEPQHLPAWRAQRDREAKMPYDLPSQNVPFHRAQRDREAEMPYDLPIPEEEQPIGTHRPKILQSDRPNWAQQSQCGDEMKHHFLQVPTLHRKRGENPTEQKAARPAPARRHSSAPNASSTPSAEPMLITNAVKLIKKEERKQRRQSVMGFFKKL